MVIDKKSIFNQEKSRMPHLQKCLNTLSLFIMTRILHTTRINKLIMSNVSCQAWSKINAKFDHTVNYTNCIWFAVGMRLLEKNMNYYYCCIYNHLKIYILR